MFTETLLVETQCGAKKKKRKNKRKKKLASYVIDICFNFRTIMRKVTRKRICERSFAIFLIISAVLHGSVKIQPLHALSLSLTHPLSLCAVSLVVFFLFFFLLLFVDGAGHFAYIAPFLSFSFLLPLCLCLLHI
uniref:Uncharacterized protein n=1 Tax=Trypanosoma congolense (strain IL3000) TaxID=1068625 RepID=G0UR08_TRYCI|nr:hypothetical protein, unlikely [Trypanosoma congolense IL3000]